MWPFRRRARDTGEGDAPAGQPEAAPARPEREWVDVPALRPVGLRPEPLLTDPGQFEAGLTTRWRPPPILEPLGHELTLSAPAGLTSGVVAPVEGYQNAPALQWAEQEEEPPQLAVVTAQTLPVREVPSTETEQAPVPLIRSVPPELDEPTDAPAAPRTEGSRADLAEEPADESADRRLRSEPPAEAADEPERDEPAHSEPAPRVRRIGRVGSPLHIDPVPPAVLRAPEPGDTPPLTNDIEGEAPVEGAGAPTKPSPMTLPIPTPDPGGRSRQADVATPAEARDDRPVVRRLVEPEDVDRREGPAVDSAVDEPVGGERARSPQAATPAPEEPDAPQHRSPADAPQPPPAVGEAVTDPALETPEPARVRAQPFAQAEPTPTRPLVSARPPLADAEPEPISLLPGLIPDEPPRAAPPPLMAPPESPPAETFGAVPHLPFLPSMPGFPGAQPQSADAESAARPTWPGLPMPPGMPQLPGFPPQLAEQMSAASQAPWPMPMPQVPGHGRWPGQQATPPAPDGEALGGPATPFELPPGTPPWVAEMLSQTPGPQAGPLRMAPGMPPPAVPSVRAPFGVPAPGQPDESWSDSASAAVPGTRPRRRRMGRIGAPTPGEDADSEPPAAPFDAAAALPSAPPGPFGAAYQAVPPPASLPLSPSVADDGEPDGPDATAGLDEDDEADELDEDDHASEHLDDLAGQLYDRLRDRLRRELLVDRERSLMLTDWR